MLSNMFPQQDQLRAPNFRDMCARQAKTPTKLASIDVCGVVFKLHYVTSPRVRLDLGVHGAGPPAPSTTAAGPQRTAAELDKQHLNKPTNVVISGMKRSTERSGDTGTTGGYAGSAPRVSHSTWYRRLVPGLVYR